MKLYSIAINTCLLLLISSYGADGQGRNRRFNGRFRQRRPFFSRGRPSTSAVSGWSPRFNSAFRGSQSILGNQFSGTIPGRVARGEWRVFGNKGKVTTTTTTTTTSAPPVTTKTTTTTTSAPPVTTTKKQLTLLERTRKERLEKLRLARLQKRRRKTKEKKTIKKTRTDTPLTAAARKAEKRKRQQQKRLQRQAKLKALREKKQKALERRQKLREMKQKARQKQKGQVPKLKTDKIANSPITKQQNSETNAQNVAVGEKAVDNTPVRLEDPFNLANTEQQNTNNLLGTNSQDMKNLRTADPNRDFIDAKTGMSLGQRDTNIGIPSESDTTNMGTPLGTHNFNLRTPFGPTIVKPPESDIGKMGAHIGSFDSNVGMPLESGISNMGTPLGLFDSNTGMFVEPGAVDMGTPLGQFDSNTGMLVEPGAVDMGTPFRQFDSNTGMLVEPGAVDMGTPLGQFDSNTGMLVEPGAVDMGTPLGQFDSNTGMLVEPGAVDMGTPLGQFDSNTGMLVEPGAVDMGTPLGPFDPELVAPLKLNVGSSIFSGDTNNPDANVGDPIGSPINAGTPLSASDSWINPEIGEGIPAVFQDINLNDFFGSNDTAGFTNKDGTTRVANDVPKTESTAIILMNGETMPVPVQSQADSTGANQIAKTGSKWPMFGFAADISRKLKGAN